MNRLHQRLPGPQRRFRGPDGRRRPAHGHQRGLVPDLAAHPGPPGRNGFNGPRRHAPGRPGSDDAPRGGPDHRAHPWRRSELRELRGSAAARGHGLSHVWTAARPRLRLRRSPRPPLALLPVLSARRPGGMIAQAGCRLARIQPQPIQLRRDGGPQVPAAVGRPTLRRPPSASRAPRSGRCAAPPRSRAHPGPASSRPSSRIRDGRCPPASSGASSRCPREW